MQATRAQNRTGLWAFVALASIALAVIVATLLFGGGNGTEVSTSADLVPTPKIEAVEAVVPASDTADLLPESNFEPVSFTSAPELASSDATDDEAAAAEGDGDGTAGASGGDVAASSTDTSADTTTTSADSSASTGGTAADTTAPAAAPAAQAGTPDASGAAPAAPTNGASRYVSAAEAFTYVAYSNVAELPVFDAPGGNQFRPTYQFLDGSVIDYPLNGSTYFGNALALRVVEGGPGSDWLRVQLPVRPNGQTGWVRSADVTLGSSDFYVQVNVSNNTVAVWQGETLIANTAVATGTSATPTPVLSTFLDEKLLGPSPAYGPYLLSLGAYSNAHNTFAGGLPKIALHGNNDTSVLGSYASNGCIRLPNDVITMLYNTVPVGTRVDIVT